MSRLPLADSSSSDSPCSGFGAPALAPASFAGLRVVVTGGAGFIGSHLVEALLRCGSRVHAVDDLSGGSLANLAVVADQPSFRFTRASVADVTVAAACCADADLVFHLAGAVGVQRLAAEPLAVMQRNLSGTQSMLAAAAAASVPILITSSSEVYGDGPVPFREVDPVRPGATEGRRGGYACAKAMGEWLALGHRSESGLPVVVTRLFNTVGPRQSADHGMVLPRFVEQAVRGEPITVYGTGAQTRCFAHVHDVVRALMDLCRARGAAGRVFNVGSEDETTMRELAELVRSAAGSASPIRTIPFDNVFPAGFGDPPRRVPSLERLRAAIGWVPKTPLPLIIAELVAIARGDVDPVGAAQALTQVGASDRA
jgi:UDP-glucose 4-epimerase